MDARTYDVTQYGAAGDGKAMDTRGIQKAVDACAADGGGTVTVPAGEYLTGTIRLKSDVTLYLSPGARLVGSPDIRDYAGIGYIHNELGEVKPLVWAMDAVGYDITSSRPLKEMKINFNRETRPGDEVTICKSCMETPDGLVFHIEGEAGGQSAFSAELLF